MKTKIHLETSFKSMWHEIKTWSYLELHKFQFLEHLPKNASIIRKLFTLT